MDAKLESKLERQISNSAEIEKIAMRVAYPIAARVAAATPRDTSRTATSTRVEGGHRSADGKTLAVWVVQSAAAVQQQFGNAHERTPARQFDNAFR